MPIGLGRGPFTAPRSMQHDSRSRRALAVSSRRKVLDADSRPFVLRSGLAGSEYRSSLSTHFESYGVGREDQHEPVAPPKRRTDFVVPLLGTLDVDFAVPDRGPVAVQDIDQSVDELPIHGCPRLGRGAVGGRRGAALARASSLGRLDRRCTEARRLSPRTRIPRWCRVLYDFVSPVTPPDPLSPGACRGRLRGAARRSQPTRQGISGPERSHAGPERCRRTGPAPPRRRRHEDHALSRSRARRRAPGTARDARETISS